MKQFGYRTTGRAHQLKRKRHVGKSTRVRRTKEEKLNDDAPLCISPQGETSPLVYSNNDFERYRELMKCKTIWDM